MSRRVLVPLVLATIALAACGANSDVDHLASDPLEGDSSVTFPELPDGPSQQEPSAPGPDETPDGSPDGTGPQQPPPGSEPGPDNPTEPAPDGPSPGDPDGPDVVEPEFPADCQELPEDAPGLIVTGPDGGIYEAGPAGTQVLVAPGAIGEVPHYAFRGEDGTVWFGTGGFNAGTIYTYDGEDFEERASGTVSFQHVGRDGDETAAVYNDFDDGAIYLETSEGERTEVAETSTDQGTAGPLGIGDGVVTIVRDGASGTSFDYVTSDGEPVEDWYDPTSENGGARPTLIAPDPDNERLTWFEQAGNEAVVADAESGDELARVQLDISGTAFSSDFTGRWYVYTDNNMIEPTTYLVDVDADEPEAIVPCAPIGKATIDRLPTTGGEGGDDPETSEPGGPESRT